MLYLCALPIIISELIKATHVEITFAKINDIDYNMCACDNACFLLLVTFRVT